MCLSTSTSCFLWGNLVNGLAAQVNKASESSSVRELMAPPLQAALEPLDTRSRGSGGFLEITDFQSPIWIWQLAIWPRSHIVKYDNSTPFPWAWLKKVPFDISISLSLSIEAKNLQWYFCLWTEFFPIIVWLETKDVLAQSGFATSKAGAGFMHS